MQQHELTDIEQIQAEQQKPPELADGLLQDVTGATDNKQTGSMSNTQAAGITTATGIGGIVAGAVGMNVWNNYTQNQKVKEAADRLQSFRDSFKSTTSTFRR